MAIQIDPRASTGGAQSAYALKKIRLKSESAQKLTYTDADGRAFNLTIGRKTEVDYSLYTRSGALPVGTKAHDKTPRERATEALHLFGVEIEPDPTLQKAIKRYRQLIEGQVFGSAPGRIQPRPPLADQGGRLFEGIESISVSETLTIDMDVVDTEYWSAENTAKRLVDFALSLYAGGDRQAHLEKMVAGLEEGFNQAKEAFGGWLPDISARTIDLAKKNLAQWASEGAPSVDAA